MNPSERAPSASDPQCRADAPGTPDAAYGELAAQRLGDIAPAFVHAAEEFVDAFYDSLRRSDDTRDILASLDDDAMRLLRQQQCAHLRFLLDAATTRDSVLRRAAHVGRVHALVGAGSSLVVRAQSLYRSLLAAVIDGTGLGAQQRYELSRIVEQRLHDDMQGQTESAERVVSTYWAALARPYAAPGTAWADASADEVSALGALPGIRAALLLRLGHDGVLTVERSAGPAAAQITEVMQAPDTSVLIDPAQPRGQGLVALAWRTRQPQSTPSYATDPRLSFWTSQARQLGVRSTFALPVLDEDSRVVACVYLYGAHANQFEADWMREFGRGLQRRWEQTWHRCRGASAFALSEGVAQGYRSLLLDGGLAMYAQPVIDLRSGEVHSLEALARLALPDGRVIGPASFLPLLGNAELDQLFRLGLAQVLDWLAQQAPQESRLSVSLNLAPSTLLNPDCVRWVADALRERGLDAGRLHLELLETQELDSAAQRHALEQLAALGVRLSMDDLGSGYSSLERLSRLPFDVIKIDQGLLATIRTHPARVVSLVGSLVQMAHDLHREAVVEGLEDADAVEAVSLLGAHFGQGFGLCRPMPLHAIGPWLREFRPAVVAGPQVRTQLGALAYHWRFVRTLHTPASHTDLETCPLTDYLREVAPHDDEVARWHVELHDGVDVDAASQRLSDWLVQRITSP